MPGYLSDEDNEDEESEYEKEKEAALTALLEQMVVDDDKYQQKYFGELSTTMFNEKMDPRKIGFLDIAVAHVQAALTAKSEKITTGLRPEELEQVMRDLSGQWIDLKFLASTIFSTNEAIHRNPVLILHHVWFSRYVEFTSDGLYRVKETEEIQGVLEMLKEGASYSATKKALQDANRDEENDRPANRARFMHGCNFLTDLIITSRGQKCKSVDWQLVQNVYSEIMKTYEQKDTQSNSNSDVNDKMDLYRNVLRLDKYKSLNGDLMKYITGRRKATDAFCQPLFLNIRIESYNNSGGFTVFIEDDDNVYTQEDIDRSFTSNNSQMSHQASQMSKKEAEQIRRQEELKEKKATYTPKYAPCPMDVIPEIQSTSHSKAAISTTYDCDRTTDDELPITSGLAPMLTSAMNRKSEIEKPEKLVRSQPVNNDSDGDDFSSAGEIDGNKNSQYSDEEGDRVRRGKNTRKSTSHESRSNANEEGCSVQNRYSPFVNKHKPFAAHYSDENDDDEVEDAELNEEQLISHERTPINNLSISIFEEDVDGLDFESHKIVFNDLQMLIGRDISDQPIILPGSSMSSDVVIQNQQQRRMQGNREPDAPASMNISSPSSRITHPQALYGIHPDRSPLKEKGDQIARERRKKEEEERRMKEEEQRKREHQRREPERKEQQRREAEREEQRREAELQEQLLEKYHFERQREYEEALRIRREQEKEDELYAKELQNKLNAESLQIDEPEIPTNDNYNQRMEDYNERRNKWSKLGHLNQESTSNLNRREFQPSTSNLHLNEKQYKYDSMAERKSQTSNRGSCSSASFVTDSTAIQFGSSGLSEDPLKMERRQDAQYSNGYIAEPHSSYQLQNDITSDARSHVPYAPSHAGTSLISASQRVTRGSGQCGASFDNGKSSSRAAGFICNVPSDILNNLRQIEAATVNNSAHSMGPIVRDLNLYHVDLTAHRPTKSREHLNSGPQRTRGIPNDIDSCTINCIANRGPASVHDYSGQRYEREMDHGYDLDRYTASIQNRYDERGAGRYTRSEVPRNNQYSNYNTSRVPSAERYNGFRPGTSNSYYPPNISNTDVRDHPGCGYTNQRPTSNLRSQEDAFAQFIKYYMIMFTQPGAEIQWSEMTEHCKKIHPTFRYNHPFNIFGLLFVHQLREILPKYINVCALKDSNEAIFAIDESGGKNMFPDPPHLFIECIYSFLLAFGAPIKWLSIAENNLRFPCPDAVFGTLRGGSWIDEFNDLALRMNVPVKAQKPLTHIYLSLL